MNKILRLDDCFLHGRIAIIWTRKLNIERIYIVNDEIVNDEFMHMTLRLAKPKNVSMIFSDLHSSIELLNQENDLEGNSMVVVNSMIDILYICENLKCIHSVNLGGLRGNPSFPCRKINGFVSLTQDDLNICEKLHHMGIEIESRQVPDEKKTVINGPFCLK